MVEEGCFGPKFLSPLWRLFSVVNKLLSRLSSCSVSNGFCHWQRVCSGLLSPIVNSLLATSATAPCIQLHSQDFGFLQCPLQWSSGDCQSTATICAVVTKSLLLNLNHKAGVPLVNYVCWSNAWNHYCRRLRNKGAWCAGSRSLGWYLSKYSTEHYECCAAHLAPGTLSWVSRGLWVF